MIFAKRRELIFREMHCAAAKSVAVGGSSSAPACSPELDLCRVATMPVATLVPWETMPMSCRGAWCQDRVDSI